MRLCNPLANSSTFTTLLVCGKKKKKKQSSSFLLVSPSCLLFDCPTYLVLYGTDVKEKAKPQFLYAITGLGNNSVDGRARIRPALARFLKDRGMRFVDQSGVVVVEM